MCFIIFGEIWVYSLVRNWNKLANECFFLWRLLMIRSLSIEDMHVIKEILVTISVGFILALDLSGVAWADGTSVALEETDESVHVEYRRLAARAKSGGGEDKFLVFAHVYRYSASLTDYIDQAADFLVEAAKLDHTEAQYNLGYMLRSGIWFEKDEEAALYWLLLAAQKDYLMAQFWAGVSFLMLSHEMSDQQEQANYRRNAIRWLRKANAAGISEAEYFLGSALIRFPESVDEGIEYLRAAAERGDDSAQKQLKYALEYVEEREKAKQE